MVAYCNDCKRYINQYCEICSGNFGIKTCDRYGCGGRMLCPICGGNNLSSKRESVSTPYDFAQERERLYEKKKAASDYEAKYFAEKRRKELEDKQAGTQAAPGSRHCPLCGYDLSEDWKFCPECGVSLIKK
ncbi:MAG: zinc-ribbon domain-containing protein [Thermoplasmatota archaeon]